MFYRPRLEKNADHLYRILLLHCGDSAFVAKKMKPRRSIFGESFVDGKYLKKLKKVAEEAWARYEKNQGKEVSMALGKLQFAFPILKDFLGMGRAFDDEMEQDF